MTLFIDTVKNTNWDDVMNCNDVKSAWDIWKRWQVPGGGGSPILEVTRM